MLMMKTLTLGLTAPKLASRPPPAVSTAKTTDSAVTASGAQDRPVDRTPDVPADQRQDRRRAAVDEAEGAQLC